MKLLTNLIRFHDEFGIKKAIDIFADAGFDAIDFCADFKEYYTDVHDEYFYKEIKKYAEDKGITFPQAHAPGEGSFSSGESEQERFDGIVKSMKNSALAGAQVIVVHPLLDIECKDKDSFNFMMEKNIVYYKKLIPYAQEYGIKIATENMEGITKTASGVKELLSALESEWATFCFDAGHANVCGQDVAGMIEELKGYISCTHIHDNNGVRDLHTLPFFGNINWESVMKVLANTNYCGNLSFEAGAFVDNVPLDFRGESAKYMAKTGKYLIERYEHYRKNKQ